ncbi:hypothetical protein M673_02965 [Aureimonas sp. AU20]|nr:hypothetical protein M673_02965 [Aureimonas sp. AU20]
MDVRPPHGSARESNMTWEQRVVWTGTSNFDRRRSLARPGRFEDALARGRSLVRDRPASALFALLVLVSLAFAAFPHLDLAVSGLFAVPGQGFPLSRDEGLLAIRDLNRVLPIWIASALALLLLARGLWGARRFLPPPHAILHVLSVYLVACLGIVHMLKNTVGRARPEHILAFGGEDRFTVAWQFSDACRTNCSFSSGEAASAMAMMALAMLAPRGLRLRAGLTLLLPMLVFSLNRVAFGSHFLSDVLVSWLVVALTALLLGRVFARHAAAIDGGIDGRWRAPLARALKRLRVFGRDAAVQARALFLRAAA